MKTSYLQRVFELAFVALSLMPLLMLLYLYMQFETEELIAIPMEQFRLLIVSIGVTSLFLFFFLRSQFGKVAQLSTSIRRVLAENMDRNTILSLTREEGEIAELAGTFNEIISRLEDNIRELQDTQNTLFVVLSKVGKALTSPQDFDTLVNLILETTADSLGVRQGAVFAFDEGGRLELRAATGLSEEERGELVKAVPHHVEQAAREQRMIEVVSEMSGSSRREVMSPPVITTALSCKEKNWGVLLLSGKRKGGGFTPHDREIIRSLGYQMAIAFENSALNRDIEKTYFETMAALALAVEAKDAYSRGHSERVGEYATVIGDALGLSDKDLATLQDASRLHDIGKIGVADRILNKPSALTADERELIRQHTLIGESIVKPLKSFEHLLLPIRHHHEFLDGTGYPDGLKAEAISLLTRVITVADIFDAISSDRSYRKGMSLPKVKEELQAMVDGGKIDGSVVSTLFRLMDEGKLSLAPAAMAHN